ncbi:MAG: hypothetical protein ACLR8P_06220 [Clostridium fessum]
MENVEYTASLANSTRDRAYELWICMNRIFRQSSEKIRKWDFCGIYELR